MKTVGWIAVFIGIVNLLCVKLLPGLSFSIFGGLILMYYASKGSHNSMSNSNNGNCNVHADDGMDALLSLAMDVKNTEKLIDADFKSWEQSDILETVESFKRWASNQRVQILDVKNSFFKSFNEVFGNDDIKDILFHLKAKEREEAVRFNIKERNTCTHYMIKWLKETQVAEQKQKNVQGKITSNSARLRVRNRMPAETLVINNNSEIEFVENPNTGNLFFKCGNVKGYVSPAVRKVINTVELADLQYAECARPESDEWIPCLMMLKQSQVYKKKEMGNDILNTTSTNSAYNKHVNNDDLPF